MCCEDIHWGLIFQTVNSFFHFLSSGKNSCHFIYKVLNKKGKFFFSSENVCIFKLISVRCFLVKVIFSFRVPLCI